VKFRDPPFCGKRRNETGFLMKLFTKTFLFLSLPLFSWAGVASAPSFMSGINKLINTDRAVFEGKSSGKACKIEVLNSKEEVTFLGEVEGKMVAFVNVTRKSQADRSSFGEKLVVGNFSRRDKTTQKKSNDAVVISKDKNEIKMIRVQATVAGVEQQVTCWVDPKITVISKNTNQP